MLVWEEELKFVVLSDGKCLEHLDKIEETNHYSLTSVMSSVDEIYCVFQITSLFLFFFVHLRLEQSFN